MAPPATLGRHFSFASPCRELRVVAEKERQHVGQSGELFNPEQNQYEPY
jgi:hypothetical protein